MSQKRRTKADPNDMFTTDPDKIRAYIASSRPYASSIDPDIMLKINVQAHKLTQGDLTEYMQFFNTLDEETRNMMMQFQHILDQDPRIAKILKKKYPTEEELLYVSSWKCTNDSDYYHWVNPDYDPHPFDANDYI
jgi:hypothetical protein